MDSKIGFKFKSILVFHDYIFDYFLEEINKPLQIIMNSKGTNPFLEMKLTPRVKEINLVWMLLMLICESRWVSD